jgi:hypothetical protein
LQLECTPFRGRLSFHMGRHILYRDGFVSKDVWDAPHRGAVTVRAGHTDERHRGAGDGQRFSTITVEISLRRRHHFYLLNVVLPVRSAARGGASLPPRACVMKRRRRAV